ncbi:MAG: flagellar basal body P-ring formation protein FlgA [Alphaproteobacteria bacterium]|nr:flagellar basal body P-ring formation protein FlgA [Alphaproteobacteria bacterium]
MIRTLIASALAFTLAGEAAAQSEPARLAPRLKELVSIDSEFVRAGDLVQNAGALASVAVFRAPDLGHTGSVPAERVVEALRSHGITGIDAGHFAEVVVTRPSRTITRAEITERITQALAGKFGLGDAASLSVNLDRELRTMHVEASATSDLVVTRLQVEPRSGRFDASFELPGSRLARRLPLRFTGTVTETVEATTLVRALRNGEVIKPDDVRIERRPKSEVGTDTVDDRHAVGLSAARPMRAGQILRTADLTKPQLVQRNEIVTIHYSVPGVALTVRGKATEGGAAGDIIGVLNAQSNRTIQATVAGPGQVVVTATQPFVAAASPSVDNPAQPRIQ